MNVKLSRLPVHNYYNTLSPSPNAGRITVLRLETFRILDNSSKDAIVSCFHRHDVYTKGRYQAESRFVLYFDLNRVKLSGLYIYLYRIFCPKKVLKQIVNDGHKTKVKIWLPITLIGKLVHMYVLQSGVNQYLCDTCISVPYIVTWWIRRCRYQCI